MADAMTTITRRALLAQAAMAGAATLGAPLLNLGRYQLFGAGTPQYSARALALMERALVIDMLCPLTLDFAQQARWEANPELLPEAMVRELKDSGINVMHPALGLGGPNAYEQALLFFSRWNSLLAGSDTRFMRIDTAGDLARVKASGKVGVLLGLQNSEHFRTPADVALFHGLGQRVSQLTYNSRNLIGNGVATVAISRWEGEVSVEVLNANLRDPVTLPPPGT
jgi:membrane dipeptidase